MGLEARLSYLFGVRPFRVIRISKTDLIRPEVMVFAHCYRLLNSSFLSEDWCHTRRLSVARVSTVQSRWTRWSFGASSDRGLRAALRIPRPGYLLETAEDPLYYFMRAPGVA